MWTSKQNQISDSWISIWKVHIINRDEHLIAELMGMVWKVAEEVGRFVDFPHEEGEDALHEVQDSRGATI